jgi:hypothetical protein
MLPRLHGHIPVREDLIFMMIDRDVLRIPVLRRQKSVPLIWLTKRILQYHSRVACLACVREALAVESVDVRNRQRRPEGLVQQLDTDDHVLIRGPRILAGNHLQHIERLLRCRTTDAALQPSNLTFRQPFSRIIKAVLTARRTM